MKKNKLWVYVLISVVSTLVWVWTIYNKYFNKGEFIDYERKVA